MKNQSSSLTLYLNKCDFDFEYKILLNMSNQNIRSVFKQATRVSFIQNKNIAKRFVQRNIEQKKDSVNVDAVSIIEQNIQQHVDQNSMRLIRGLETSGTYIVFNRKGRLFTQKKSTSFFSCFSSKPRPSEVELINRKLYIRISDRLKSFINFDAVTVIYSDTQNTMTLTIKNRLEKFEDREFYFQALQREQEDFEHWKQIIREAIKDSLGAKNELNYITIVPDYFTKPYITESEFTLYCNSGDIILFKSEHTMAQVQRGATGSDYDHVGLLLKNKKGEIVIFQSSSDSGVAFTFWKDLIRFKWYYNVEKIAYRRLEIQRNQQFLGQIEEFVVNNLDKKFDLGLEKIFKFTSVLQKTKQEEASRTFFCSELVAACYKHIGLLQKQKSSTQYWPLDFSDAKHLPLLKGKLHPENVICFQRKLYGTKYD